MFGILFSRLFEKIFQTRFLLRIVNKKVLTINWEKILRLHFDRENYFQKYFYDIPTSTFQVHPKET